MPLLSAFPLPIPPVSHVHTILLHYLQGGQWEGKD